MYGYAITSGDFDGDGRPDIALGGVDATSGNYSVKVFLNQGGGAFRVGEIVPANGKISNIVVTDFNGDGILDFILAADAGPSTLTFASGYGNGFFGVSTEATPMSIPWEIGVADFDQDGTSDLFVNELDLSTQQNLSNSAVYLNRSMSTATFSNVSVPGSGKQGTQATADNSFDEMVLRTAQIANDIGDAGASLE